jgi:site-specific recombinase XerC
VFCREDGSPETQARARSQWRIALREAGLGYFAPKNLRHSFAPGTLVATSDLHSTSKLLGHRRLATTDANYLQPVTPLQREAVRKLQEAVRGQQTTGEP